MESDDVIAGTIDALLARRAAAASICPSEVARELSPEGESWRALMPEIRRVAATMAGEGRLLVTRGDLEVDAMFGGGPIRLRRPR